MTPKISSSAVIQMRTDARNLLPYLYLRRDLLLVYLGRIIIPLVTPGRAGKFGSIIEVKRIDGKNFETTDQAAQHGLELAKRWVDKHANHGSSE
jgi:hypothetical protein